MIKTPEQIDAVRQKGFRPGVVGCFLHDKKILLLYKKEHNLWQLPQGGIENGETIERAFSREMSEELGAEFVKSTGGEIAYVAEDKVEFPLKKQGDRDLQTDDGQPIKMKGKKYFFVCAYRLDPQINIEETEFDDFRWVDFDAGIKLAEKIYQKGKQRITLKILNKLKSLDLIS